MDNLSRRNQLADFLRTRRERLMPRDAGIHPGTRRRAKGLRREEVAELAGIGVTWYTWLEQGRDVQASQETIENLVRALKLNAEERRHLFLLARDQAPPAAGILEETVSPALQIFLDNQALAPSYVLGRAWDILAWNRLAALLFGDFGAMPKAERNIVRHMFLDPAPRRQIADWEMHAQHMVEQFRVSCDRFAGDPHVNERVAALKRESDLFRRLWSKHEVRVNLDGVKTLNHHKLGKLELHHISLGVVENPDMRIVAYVAEPGSETATKLQALIHEP